MKLWICESPTSAKAKRKVVGEALIGEVMDNKNKLPAVAYEALTALKDQANAVSANSMKGDKLALVDAQQRMRM